MSKKLARLRKKFLRNSELDTERKRLGWLNLTSYEMCAVEGQEGWGTSLNAMARHSRQPGESMEDAWFRVAALLTEAVRDPEDLLYGISLSAYAWANGIRYGNPSNMARLLVGLRESLERSAHAKGLSATESADLALFCIRDQIDRVGAALRSELRNGEPVVAELAADPEVVLASIALMNSVVTDVNENRKRDGAAELTDVELQRYVEEGGHYLWACFHAKRFQVTVDELIDFVVIFANQWFEVMNDLVRERLLAPGVLSAYIETEATIPQLAADGTALVATYNEERPDDLTLTQYFTNCLLAAAEC